MVRRTPSLLRLAPLALLVAAGSCSHARPRPTLREREAQCAPAWKAAHADIEARGSACTADWECREVRPEYLGCDAWANVDFKLSEGRIVELESACAPISFVPDCGERVGACRAGRCTGRPAVRDAAACVAAKSEALAKIQWIAARAPPGPIRCRSQADCSVVNAFGGRTVGMPRDSAREIHAVSEACLASDEFITRGGATSPSVSRCVEGTCVLEPTDAEGLPVRAPFSKAEFADKNCVGKGFQFPSTIAGATGKLTVTFRVSTRGVPYAFEFEGTRRRDLMFALAEAVSSCALAPAHRGEVPLDIRMFLPILFARE